MVGLLHDGIGDTLVSLAETERSSARTRGFRSYAPRRAEFQSGGHLPMPPARRLFNEDGTLSDEKIRSLRKSRLCMSIQ